MSLTINLSGKTALVTGGGTGLGQHTAIRLAEAGAQVILASNDVPSIEETAEVIRQSGGEVLAIETDVSQPDSVSQMANQIQKELDGIDILVNNAAIYPSKPVEEVTVEEWDQVFAVNSRGYFLCAKAAIPHMREKNWGRIINISSITYFVPFSNLIHYVSTKGAAIGFTRALANELGAAGITVNSIAPGAFPTKAEEIHEDRDAYNQKILDSQCLKRRGTPDDIANTVLFFASDLSSFITGQSLLVDGGWAVS
ncbi:NAD(P)-dependent dehydrogenase, short-chain alcohol dehydrogenase family [Seinonella peptonophila]|uniref:NAD(P)-dependent dehydrogenase, short-chain alcohol dehydrogenase family n=1 Tax=Seinonella peptonophila TaxID=112248 RepID=A0A1M4T3F7_9BACL|nr:glucose 1-dehydrogenase [Seinonella peptonophila]SHE38971.1 NAD(P)-dependent dehydrogenase, short-chain alcohol dehydrogenase family [Seinonella peptonophila]